MPVASTGGCVPTSGGQHSQAPDITRDSVRLGAAVAAEVDARTPTPSSRKASGTVTTARASAAPTGACSSDHAGAASAAPAAPTSSQVAPSNVVHQGPASAATVERRRDHRAGARAAHRTTSAIATGS